MVAGQVRAGSLPLRGYQEEALLAIRRATERGLTRQLVCLPTGTGKTVVFAHLARERRGRVLILAHREELIRQAVSKLHAVDGRMTVGVALERRPRGTPPPRILVGSVQALSQPRRLAKGVPHFRTIVVDEAHHGPAPSYQRLLAALGAFEDGPDAPLVVGFTATPSREDNRRLSETWQRVVYRKTLVDMISAGFLCDLRALEVRLDTDFGLLKLSHGDFDQNAAGAMLQAAGAPALIAAAYDEHARSRQGLVFAPTVALAEEFAIAFREHGISAGVVSGKTPTKQRRQIISDFMSCRIKVLVNCGVLTEGFDAPEVSCVVIARPTKSKSLYVQMIGRGTRVHPAKSDCLVLDVAGATRNHDLMTSASLFSVRDGFEDGASLRELRQSASSSRPVDDGPVDSEPAPPGPRATEAHTGPVNIFHGGQAQWLEMEPTLYVLPLPNDGHVALTKSDDSWSAYVWQSGKTTVLGTDLALTWAQGIAEDHVRANGGGWLADPTARWRNAAPSGAQMSLLHRMGVPIPAECTRGQASDMITMARVRDVTGQEALAG
ncbi:MAG: DEAD/DEAH box helicase [Candidatus Dormibacteria bacterium]